MSRKSEQAVALIERIADHHGMRVDRGEITRWLPTEALQTQEDLLAWLVSSGGRVGIRIGYADCDFNDIAAFARHGIPIAVQIVDLEEAGHWADDDSGLGGNWLLVTKYGHLRKFRVENVGNVGEHRWVSAKQLRKMVGLSGERRVRCLIAQPLAADPLQLAEERSNHPLMRLIRMFRPDAGDIWAIVIFSLVVGILTLATPLAVEALVNTVAFGRYVQPVLILALIMFVFLGFASALRLLLTVIAELLQRRLFVRVAEDLGYRLPRVAAQAFDGKSAQELVNRFLDVANIQKTSASLLLDGIGLLVSALVGMAVLGFYHTFLLGFDIAMLSLMAFVIFVLGRGAVNSARVESKAKYSLTAWLEDLVRCPTAFSLHGGQRFAMERTDKLAVDYLDARRRHFSVLLRQITFALVMYAVSLTVLLGLGGYLVIIGDLTLGQLVAAELIVGVVVGAFAKMGKHMESYYDMLASVDKVGVLLDLPTEPLGGPLQLDGVEPARLVLRDVTAAAGSRKILKGFSCEPKQAGFTAVVGSPGSGKSVLFDLLAARRPLQGGEIIFDGNALNQLDSETLRYQIGFARDSEVFVGTLAENVHLFRPQIRTQDVRDALATVGLTEDVLGFADGLETKLAANGSPLSRDQALRLMVARAIVGRPRLLLIDGTLDGLSDGSLDRVLTELTRRPQPWTLLVTTGRQSISMRADQIWDLDRPSATTSAGGSTDRTS
jgi:ABC-type bacteriocin/lantibiotic exporter with double-glycine peptidase domain